MKRNIETVMTFELWQDVQAYGTYERGRSDNEIWSMNGKLYRLCFADLPRKEQKELLESYR